MALVRNKSNYAINEDLFSSLKEDDLQLTEREIQKARRGDGHTLNEIGDEYHYNKNDYSKALAWYREAAAQNNSQAHCNIGFMYYFGIGVPEDPKVAMLWYLKAVNIDNNKHAKFMIGEIYQNEHGSSDDIQDAVKWYTEAAMQEHSLAQWYLGRIYETNEKVRDIQKAQKWTFNAIENGLYHLYEKISKSKTKEHIPPNQDKAIPIEEKRRPTYLVNSSTSMEEENDTTIKYNTESQPSPPLTPPVTEAAALIRQNEEDEVRLLKKKMIKLEQSLQQSLNMFKQEMDEKEELQQRVNLLEENKTKLETEVKRLTDTLEKCTQTLDNNPRIAYSYY